MRGGLLITVLICAAQSLGFAAVPSCLAADKPGSAPADSPNAPAQPATIVAPVPTDDPVVRIIRSKLADPAMTKGAEAADIAALKNFYAGRSNGPVWITEMGFSAKGQAALFEIEKAGDWGLDASAFALPLASDLPKGAEAEALAEIKLGLAILKYARFARGGRLTPSEVSDLFDQEPPLRDPSLVLAEIASADAPDAYLRSLQPKHEQFLKLQHALVVARDKEAAGGKSAPSETDIKRLILNMERWRWMPEDLGPIYVINNSPEFMLYVVKDGKTIYSDKTLVGTLNYATPVFSADMQTIVFNPNWIAPETVLTEDLLPPLRRKNYSILAVHRLAVSYQGKPVNVARVNWSRVNILDYTFTQKPGPYNVLGKIKFLYPNRHTVYMHDTLPVRKKYFLKPVRAIGHECVRMEKPKAFAETVLAEANAMKSDDVKMLWDKGVNESVTLERPIPVHTTYFTAVADEAGEVKTFKDLYGLDSKLAAALFGSAKGFPMPPPERKKSQTVASGAPTTDSGIVGAIQGLLGD